MIQKKIYVVIFCLLLTVQMFSQTKTDENKRPELSEELKGKTNSLLISLSREAEQFFLPENRISARAMVANLMWESDEKQARQLFQNSVGEMETLINGMLTVDETDDTRYMRLYELGELRKSLLFQIANHDPSFALSAFRSLSKQNANGEDVFDGEKDFEVELAKNIAQSDPKQAFDVAMKKLEEGFPYGIFETVDSIFSKDNELGAKLASAVLKKIKKQNPEGAVKPTGANSNSNSAANTSATPNPIGAEEEITIWQIKEFADKVRSLNRKAIKEKKTPALTESEYRDLIGVMARIWSTQQYLSAYEVASSMNEITTYFPAMAQTIRRKLAGEKANLETMTRASAFEVEMEDKSIAEIIELIDKKPLAERDELFHKAAETVFNEGDIISAKNLYDRVKTKPEYDYLGDQITAGLPLAMAAEGSADEVRQILSDVKTPEEKVEILSTLAMTLGEKGNLKLAKELTAEARATFTGKARNRRSMNSIMYLTGAYAAVEPDQSFSFLESNFSAINDIIAAGIIVDEFNEYGSVREDELLLSVVMPQSYQNMPKGVALLRNMSKADFERTVGVADRFSRRELRFFARFRIVQALLDPKAEEIEAANQQSYEGEGC